MLCPACKIPLTTLVRYKVEVDICPQCRGVWLDRGELDKIIAHSIQHHEEQTAQSPANTSEQPLRPGERRHVYPPPEQRRRFMLERYFD
ncbi:MAG: zf-TFIIB domain-containing protein [Saprospiraceae bacterium]|nr:zf-TFIIB domain-containing protein [Saprospiraceae bacterium]MDW8485281.1 zf-TFIIB domain-containing protein [Saprospiraceae bacterium]